MPIPDPIPQCSLWYCQEFNFVAGSEPASAKPWDYVNALRSVACDIHAMADRISKIALVGLVRKRILCSDTEFNIGTSIFYDQRDD